MLSDMIKLVENNTISYRCLGSNETITINKNEFISYIKDIIINKK